MLPFRGLLIEYHFLFVGELSLSFSFLNLSLSLSSHPFSVVLPTQVFFISLSRHQHIMGDATQTSTPTQGHATRI